MLGRNFKILLLLYSGRDRSVTDAQVSNTHLLISLLPLRSLLEDIKTKQLKWYGHVQRMEEGRLPKKLCSGAHQEEVNEVDLILPGRKRFED